MNWAPLAEPAPGDRVPASRGVADRLQALVLRGGLAAGDRLPPQRDLAAKLGVSRPSLREAIAALDTMGLVAVREGSGVYAGRRARQGGRGRPVPRLVGGPGRRPGPGRDGRADARHGCREPAPADGAGDADGAETAMEAHIRAAADRCGISLA